MPEFKNSLDSHEGAQEVNEYLETRSFIGGFKESQADLEVFDEIAPKLAKDAKTLPHLARWYSHIASFPPCTRARWGGEKKEQKEEKKEKKAKKPKKSEKESLFGSDDEAEAKEETKEEETKEDDSKKDDEETDSKFPGSDDDEDDEAAKLIQKKAAEKIAADAAKGKVAPIAKSTLILDVKPLGDETNLDELEQKVRAIEMEGLRWAGSERPEIAYGLKKLRIISVIVDDLVSTDELREKIEAMEDMVQSTDIYAFNKV